MRLSFFVKKNTVSISLFNREREKVLDILFEKTKEGLVLVLETNQEPIDKEVMHHPV